MKAFINCHHDNMAWVEQFLPGENPYLLPIVNKPLIEYWLDFCSMIGVTDVMVIDSEYDVRLELFLGTGTKWNLNVQYHGDNTSSDCADFLLHHRAFLGDEHPVMVFNGLFFQHYNRNSLPDLDVLLKPGTPPITCGDGMMVFADGELRRIEECRITQISSIRRYYHLNQFILQEECDHYVIPGYKIENGIYTGMNNVIPPNCTIHPPAVLGNNVSLGSKCVLTGGSLLGENVIVDSRSVIGESVIMPNTYIGSDLEFIGKIVSHNSVIDPETDTIVNLLDAQLAGELVLSGRRQRSFGRFCGWIFTVFLLLFMIVPYFIFLLLGARSAGKKKIFACSKKPLSRYTSYHFYPDCVDLPIYRYFKVLSLDKVPMLFQVLRWKMRLVGDYPYDAEEPGTEDFIRRNYQNYQPGAFWLSELHHTEENFLSILIDDLYFEHNHSLGMEFATIVRCLIGRLLGNHVDTK